MLRAQSKLVISRTQVSMARDSHDSLGDLVCDLTVEAVAGKAYRTSRMSSPADEKPRTEAFFKTARFL